MIIEPEPTIVPSPISMESPAQITVALIPTFFPNTNRASGASVRRTLGWKQASGLARTELAIVTPSPTVMREPFATLMIGLPMICTWPKISAPLNFVSSFQRNDWQRRRNCSPVPKDSARERLAMALIQFFTLSLASLIKQSKRRK